MVTWSFLPFAVNVVLNLSNMTDHHAQRVSYPVPTAVNVQRQQPTAVNVPKRE